MSTQNAKGLCWFYKNICQCYEILGACKPIPFNQRQHNIVTSLLIQKFSHKKNMSYKNRIYKKCCVNFHCSIFHLTKGFGNHLMYVLSQSSTRDNKFHPLVNKINNIVQKYDVHSSYLWNTWKQHFCTSEAYVCKWWQ